MKAWKALLWVSMALYAIALLSPGFELAPGAPSNAPLDGAGYECLGMGALGFLDGPSWPAFVAWLANPVFFFLLFATFIPELRSKVHPALGAVPLLLSVVCLTVDRMVVDVESATRVPVVLGAGAYLWMASLFFFAPVLWLKRSGDDPRA